VQGRGSGAGKKEGLTCGPCMSALGEKDRVSVRGERACWAWAASWPGPVSFPPRPFFIFFAETNFFFSVFLFVS
jgi:hypothetical protein